MSSREPMQFVIGDLVYYNRKDEDNPLDTVGNQAVGIVTRVGRANEVWHFPVYAVYWLKDGIVSEHLANNLELVYNV
jgi:hypothetical protein